MCDNIDLDTIYLDFCSYYHMRFGKMPKILKRIECDTNDSTNAKGKINKNRSTENATKTSEECKRKAKQESSEIESNQFVVGPTSISSDCHKDDKRSEINSVKLRKSLDLFEQFSGEMRDLAYVIERFVRLNYHFSI